MIQAILSVLFAQSLDLPRIGCVLGADGEFRLLLGIRGNFLLAGSEPCEQESLKPDPDPEVLAVSSTKSGDLLVLKRGWLYVMVDDLVVSSERVAKADSAIVWPDKAMLLESEEGIVFRLPNGEETRLDIEPAAPLRRISANWVQCGSYAIERRGDQAEVYLLPEGPQ
jgi:hypothetical protein